MPNFKHFTTIFISIFIFTNSFSQDLNQEIKPLDGEGIYALLNRNGLDPKKFYNEFIALNEGKFGKDNSLLTYKTYILPVKNNTIIEPLLGEAQKVIKIENEDLKGAIFFLISGHGGPDPGASGQYGEHQLNEDEYAYDITLRLGKRLTELGAKAYYIIQDQNDGIRDEPYLLYDNDETCMGETIPLNQVERLRQRVQMVNNISIENRDVQYQRSISIHLDSRSNTKQLDVFFYYHHNSTTGKKMAETLRDTFDEKYKLHQPSRGFSGTVEERALYEVKYTRPVSVFIELGNIQNFRDQQRFILDSNRQAVANWLSEGIVKDFQNSTK